MRTRCVWTREAIGDLISLHLRSGESAAVTDAAVEVERRIASDPVRHGRPLSEGLFDLVVDPIKVIYQDGDGSDELKIVKVVGLPTSDKASFRVDG